MPRAQTNKLYNNFSRGLITEVSALAFPDNATIDELNCDIQNNGIRVRRYGLDLEPSFSSYNINASYTGSEQISEHVWKSPGENHDTIFLALQIGRYIYFYDMTASGAMSSNKKSFSIDLESYELSTYTGETKNRQCAFASGRGYLFIAHPYCDPLYVSYDAAGDSITVTQKKVKIRDFEGVDDGLAVDEEPASLSTTHHYNLRNQGWINPEATGSGTTITSYSIFGSGYSYSYPTTTGPIADYYTAKSRYPSNNKQWWVAKDVDGNFDPALLSKIFFGNTRAPRGHFIVEAFYKDRSAVSGISSITVQSNPLRPEAIEFSSGRVFFGRDSSVYFSPILDNVARMGECYQEADPTAEDISDLIATDGGVIEIPAAGRILKLMSIGNGIAVFSDRGVWFIASGAQGFTALDYSLSQVSDVPVINAGSVVRADDKILWWAKNGIQAMQQSIGQFGPIDGQFNKENITQDTIKQFYNDLTSYQKSSAKGIYDSASHKVYWLYENTGTLPNKQRFNNFLILDLTLNAFIPWSTSSTLAVPVGAYSEEDLVSGTEDYSFLKFPVIYNDGTNYRVSFAAFDNTEYVDFGDLATSLSNTNYKKTYESFLLTGYEVLEDALRRKQAPIVGIFFKRKETSASLVGGSYVLDDPQSCYFQTKWDWTVGSGANKWSTQVQAYRPKMTMFIDTGTLTPNTVDYDVIYSRNKVRGSGRAVQFKFSESREGYGFTLLGWHVFYAGNVNP